MKHTTYFVANKDQRPVRRDLVRRMAHGDHGFLAYQWFYVFNSFSPEELDLYWQEELVAIKRRR